LGVALPLVAAAVCVRLAFWQLSRLQHRRALNAELVAARGRPPVDLPGATPAESLVERRVRVHGVYDYAHERLWRPRSLEDQLGVDLVTPLVMAGGGAVLVDRGWVPSADGYHVDQEILREPDTAVIVGLGLRAPRAGGDVDPTRLRDSLPYALLPIVVQALPDSPRTERLLPVRWPMPELSEGPHLSYTIQWFSFATVILVGSAALYRKRRREQRTATTA
jgi:surfeit locus 1 family protein